MTVSLKIFDIKKASPQLAMPKSQLYLSPQVHYPLGHSCATVRAVVKREAMCVLDMCVTGRADTSPRAFAVVPLGISHAASGVYKVCKVLHTITQ